MSDSFFAKIIINKKKKTAVFSEILSNTVSKISLFLRILQQQGFY